MEQSVFCMPLGLSRVSPPNRSPDKMRPTLVGCLQLGEGHAPLPSPQEVVPTFTSDGDAVAFGGIPDPNSSCGARVSGFMHSPTWKSCRWVAPSVRQIFTKLRHPQVCQLISVFQFFLFRRRRFWAKRQVLVFLWVAIVTRFLCQLMGCWIPRRTEPW